MNWVYIILIILLITLFILGLFCNINIFRSNTDEYNKAFCKWYNFKRSMKLEGYNIELLKVSLQDNKYEFYYTIKGKKKNK